MEPSNKEDILPLKEATRKYFLRTLDLCSGNRTETAKILKISPRTVRNYCREFGIPILAEKHRPNTVVIEEDFGCIKPVSPKERDDWYNKDRF